MSWIRLREAKAGRAIASTMRRTATTDEMEEAFVRV